MEKCKIFCTEFSSIDTSNEIEKRFNAWVQENPNVEIVDRKFEVVHNNQNVTGKKFICALLVFYIKCYE